MRMREVDWARFKKQVGLLQKIIKSCKIEGFMSCRALCGTRSHVPRVR